MYILHEIIDHAECSAIKIAIIALSKLKEKSPAFFNLVFSPSKEIESSLAR